MAENVGILHPGEMGVSVAASAQNSGCTVFWVSTDRSPQTRQRAESHSLVDAYSLDKLCQVCPILISVCPPHAAEDMARQVLAQSFKGLYVDANAISPQRAMRIAERMMEGGAAFVDGGIIGGPAWKPGATWLYLSGKDAPRAAGRFSAGPLQAQVIGDKIGKASALKMCYAAYTKGTTALLGEILAAAEGLGVREALEQQWSYSDPGFSEQTTLRLRKVTAKAWRFEGEMVEIAATFAGAGMPDGFHLAAAEVYRRLVDFKGLATTPSLPEVLKALLGGVETDQG